MVFRFRKVKILAYIAALVFFTLLSSLATSQLSVWIRVSKHGKPLGISLMKHKA